MIRDSLDVMISTQIGKLAQVIETNDRGKEMARTEYGDRA